MVIYLIISFLGLGLIVLAPYVNGAPGVYTSFLPWIRAGVEDASQVTLGALALLGFLSGYLFQRRAWALGMASVALLPIWAVIEMTLDPTSHNLWPLEFGIYGFWGCVASAGALAGAFLKKSLNKN